MKKQTIKIILVAATIWVFFCLAVDIHPVGGFFDMLSETLFAPMPAIFLIFGAIMTWLDHWAEDKESKNQDAK